MSARLAFIITGLGSGGAEMMLYKLLSRIDRERFEPRVVSLTPLSALAPRFEAIGVPVHFLGMRQGVPDPRGLLRLALLLRRERPDLVQTWMYHADLLGGVAAKMAGRIPVLWNIRNGTLEEGACKGGTRMTVAACARLSRRIPERIVCCAESARRIHANLGYDAGRMTVIPNGFDTAAFRPDEGARQAVRAELGWAQEDLVVGLVARYHAQKDHRTFFRAAALVARKIPQARFLLCGDGIVPENPDLARAVEEGGLGERVRLLGPRSDVPRLTAAFDLAVSSSYSGEAFSNSLGEAMACGVPCVATDVGDAALIVGETGRIVPSRDPQALAAAMEEFLLLPPAVRRALGEAARRRVAERFSLEVVVERYQVLYEEVLEGVSAGFAARRACREA